MSNQTTKISKSNNENKILFLGVGIFVVTLFFVFAFSVLISYRSRALNGMGDSPSNQSEPRGTFLNPGRLPPVLDIDRPFERQYDFSQDVVTNSNLKIPNNTHVKGKITVNGGNLEIGHDVVLEQEVQVTDKGHITIGNNVTAKNTIQTNAGWIRIGSDNKLKDVLITSNDINYRDWVWLEAENNNEFNTIDGKGWVRLGSDNIILGDLKATKDVDEYGHGIAWIEIENNNKIYGNVICSSRFKSGSSNQIMGKSMCENSSNSSSSSISSSISRPSI